MKKITYAFFFFAALFPTISMAAMMDVPLKDMVAQADAIYLGTIGDVQTLQEPLGGDRFGVYTLVDLQIEKVLKGETKSQVSIFVIGGKIDDLDYRMSESPEYVSGEEVVVFLKWQSDGTLRTLHHKLGRKVFGSFQEKASLVNEITQLSAQSEESDEK